MKILTKVLRASYAQVALIAITVMVLYANTLSVPFYLDDYSSISENMAVTGGGLRELWQFSPQRVVGYATLALNYKYDGLNVPSYHITNIIIHLMAGLAVFGLVRAVLRSPQARQTQLDENIVWLPFITALIFALHPLQTQAVTYIVQRLASLAALFYISALACYAHARLTKNNARRIYWIGGGVALTILAFLTKQNAATLPLAMLLLEISLFTTSRARITVAIVATAAVYGLAWFVYAKVIGYNPFTLEAMQALSSETGEISRLQYAATQQGVLWQYIGLFLWPVNLHLDYDIPLASGFADPLVLVALLAHATVIGGAIFFIGKAPIPAFGILFYYLTHLVESGFVPIRDVMFEHRTYLPNMGLALAAVWLVLKIDTKYPCWRKQVQVFGIASIVAFGVATWQRNQIWRDPIRFLEDNARLASGHYRPWLMLSTLYINRGDYDKAVQVLARSIAATNDGNPNGTVIYPEVGANMVVALAQSNRHEQALHMAEMILNPDKPVKPKLRSKIWAAVGGVFLARGRYSEAEKSYRQAIELNPNHIAPLANLGAVYAFTGRLPEAEKIFLQVLEKDPQHSEANDNLRQVRTMMGR